MRTAIPYMHRAAPPVLVVCLLASACAGGEYVIRVQETVAMPGKAALLQATVQKTHSLSANDDIRDARVRFYIEGQPVGEAITNKYGQAFLEAPSPAVKVTHYEARSTVRGRQLAGRARFFHWDSNKTIIAVDIDETVSKTHYSDLFFATSDKYSEPLPHAAAVLNRLTKDYQIYYYSARPRFLHEKTHAWLARHGFPQGPYADALKFEACFHQERYKRDILKNLKTRFPNILIGIGDKEADDGAHRANRMLSLILGNKPLFGYSKASIVCKDWTVVEQFFRVHRDELLTPGALAGVIERNDMNLQPYFESRFVAATAAPALASDRGTTRLASGQPSDGG